MRNILLFSLLTLLFHTPVAAQNSGKYYRKFQNCVVYENMNRARKLLNKGYDVNDIGPDGKTILLFCLQYDRSNFIRLFLDAGADVTVTDPQGNGVLHYAIENCHDRKIVYELIEKGAEIDLANNENYTPFHFSILFACHELPFYFIEKGVNYKKITVLNENALHLSMESRCDTLTHFLLRQNINISLQDINGFTPLLDAIRFGDIRAARELIHLGADTDLTDREGNPGIFYAVVNGDTAAFRLLVNNRASMEQDSTRIPYLTIAADQEDTLMIRELLLAGAKNPDQCQTHEECYNKGLIYYVNAGVSSDSMQVDMLKISLEAFNEALRKYKYELNNLYGSQAGAFLWDLLSEAVTGTDADYSELEALREQINYYEYKSELCKEKIRKVEKKLNRLMPDKPVSTIEL